MAGRFFLLSLVSVGCAQWCMKNFANPGAVCTNLAAKGTGPCYECGPKNTNPFKQLCAGKCLDTTTDSNNCGHCGSPCPEDAECVGGLCQAKLKACADGFRCGGLVPRCGDETGFCVCFSKTDGSTMCANIRGSPHNCDVSCTDDASCGPDAVCINVCCGNTCFARTASCASALPPTKMLRQDVSFEELVASSPLFNSSLAAQ